MKILHQLRNLGSSFWRPQQDEFGQHEIARIRALNLAIIITFPVYLTLCLLMLNSSDPQWQASGEINLRLAVLLLPGLLAHQFGYAWKYIYVFFWMLGFVGVNASFGRVNGTHIPLLVMPALSLFFLGPGRWKTALGLTVASTVLFILIEYLIPWRVGWQRTLTEAILNEIPSRVSIGMHDFAFVAVVLSSVVVVFLIAYNALASQKKAEQELALEHARSELLLANMLPVAVAKQLKDSPGLTIAEKHADVSILFSDLVGFTSYSSDRTPEDVVNTLNSLFLEFDELVDIHGLEKIKTVGDAYMVAGGLGPVVESHLPKMAALALDMIEVSQRYFSRHKIEMDLRIGIHKGPAIAGVVGNKRPFYDVWGDTVNVASRMEETAQPGTIQVTRDLIDVLTESFKLERGEDVAVKGKGVLERYTLIGRK